ncbi:hypothetical protein RchiOBHm_Chr1g0370621 [Rosa chinensis]|uniref:Uncharacterized protein n=1 Tax=Rosa chinensis TaxID=74649 RepID=A0A2P6SLB5_ROSCH|nr:hypothetical protein RchiOBHm_Chr1g0370621 [Rosa chinensis]
MVTVYFFCVYICSLMICLLTYGWARITWCRLMMQRGMNCLQSFWNSFSTAQLLKAVILVCGCH